MKQAFSLLEMIFVVIIIAILISLSISNTFVSRGDAVFLQVKSDIMAVKNSLNLLKTKQSFSGKAFNLTFLDNTTNYNQEGSAIFYFEENNSSNILQSSIITKNKNGGWMKIGANSYTVKLQNKNIVFKYENKFFSCLSHNANEELELCKEVSQ